MYYLCTPTLALCPCPGVNAIVRTIIKGGVKDCELIGLLSIVNRLPFTGLGQAFDRHIKEALPPPLCGDEKFE